MGQARQRALRQANGAAPAAQPPKRETFRVIEGQVLEQTQPDGTVMRIVLFHLVDDNGGVRVLNTPAGQVPITIMSMPVPVGKGIIVPAGPVQVVQ